LDGIHTFTPSNTGHEFWPSLDYPPSTQEMRETRPGTDYSLFLYLLRDFTWKTSVGKILALRFRDCYHDFMLKKTLIDTNPYLRDPEQFRKALITSVSSSTAIETGAPVESVARMLEEHVNIEQLTMTRSSAR